MFGDANAWATLSEVLEDVLYDANLIPTFLIIDAPFCEGLHTSCRETTQFLLHLGSHVDWTAEKACFESFLKELASFYMPSSYHRCRTTMMMRLIPLHRRQTLIPGPVGLMYIG